MGLFNNPYIPDDIDPYSIAGQHQRLTLEAAQKSIVLLKNDNSTLPLTLSEQNITKIAMIGPFSDILNYGDYAGNWGAYPVHNATTLRQGILNYINSNSSSTTLLSSWGANSWEYNAQYAIPPYLLSVNGTSGGLLATYFANTNFTSPLVQKIETPTLDWGLYPPPGLPSNNFSTIWEGELQSPVSTDVDGWIGVAISPNTTSKLYIDGTLISDSTFTTAGDIQTNIEPFTFIFANSTLPPPNSTAFTFHPSTTYHIRIEYQAYTTYQKLENVDSLNSQILLF